ncbi:ATP-binding protein [Yinghuangia sp. YIM S09857]|uniref:ATP-binding protein n=1 Tax=Yinghuangia sp. YIM S09857 TaxID=3436929 RepID=UPI003F537818
MRRVVWGLSFPGEPESVGEARHFVGALLAGWPCVDDARLVVSELATNAVQHTASGDGGRFDVTVEIGADRVRISVRDSGSFQRPFVFVDAKERTGMSGRGLFLVAALSRDWGVADLIGDCIVWAEFPRDEQ